MAAYKDANKRAINIGERAVKTSDPMRPCTVIYNDPMLNALGVKDEDKEVVKEYLLSLGIRCTQFKRKDGQVGHQATANMSRFNTEIIRYLYLLEEKRDEPAKAAKALVETYQGLWGKLGKSSEMVESEKAVYNELLKTQHYITVPKGGATSENIYKQPAFIKAFCALRSCFIEKSSSNDNEFKWEYGESRLARFVRCLYDTNAKLPTECENFVTRVQKSVQNVRVGALKRNLFPQMTVVPE